VFTFVGSNLSYTIKLKENVEQIRVFFLKLILESLHSFLINNIYVFYMLIIFYSKLCIKDMDK